MIDIEYVPGKSVKITGHANYAEVGKDIVCAAISTLFCTMLLAPGIAGTRDEEGMHAVCLIPASAEVFGIFAKGMAIVAEQYPTYVRFKKGRIDVK